MTCNKPFISIGTGIAFAIIFGTAPTGAAMDNALIRSMDERLKLVDARRMGKARAKAASAVKAIMAKESVRGAISTARAITTKGGAAVNAEGAGTVG